MGRRGKIEWIREMYPRQGRFWYALGTRKSMGPLQWTGLFLLFVTYAAVLSALVYLNSPQGHVPWWRKLLETFGWSILVGVAVIVILLRGRKAAPPRASHKH